MPAPTLPEAARRLFDFEGDWQGFVTKGEAFGARPAPALAGLYGRGAADSRRFGPAAEGALHAPTVLLDRTRLRFRLVGPADPGLRVLLLDGPEVARSASPTGRPHDIEWDVAALRGRPVTLVIEDRSAKGGLAVDQIIAF
jgi:hypothetical protein